MQRFTEYLNNPKVVYGDLLPHDNAKIREDDPIISHFRKTGLMKQFENMKHPNDNETLRELMMLKQIMNDVTEDDLLFAINSENDENEMYNKFARQIGLILPSHFLPDILDKITPVMFYLKKYHNRARPEQFAAAFNVPFQTAITHTALHPAYPSGHALDSYIMEYVLSKLSPLHSDEIKTFTCKMRTSRLHAGLHYPSDNEISKHIANAIIKNNLIGVQ